MGNKLNKPKRGRRKAPKTSNIGRKKGLNNMPIFLLNPRKVRVVSVSLNLRRPKFTYQIEATHSIKVFLTDSNGLTDYRDGRDFSTYNEILTESFFYEEINLPHGGNWHLIIYNPDHGRIAGVHYELYI